MIGPHPVLCQAHNLAAYCHFQPLFGKLTPRQSSLPKKRIFDLLCQRKEHRSESELRILSHFQMAAADDVHTESELRPVSQPHLHVVHAPPAAGLQFFPRGHVFRDPEVPARLSNISAT